jgi:hypothetical protein
MVYPHTLSAELTNQRSLIQLIRVRSPDGNFRYEVQPSDDISVLVQKVRGYGS